MLIGKLLIYWGVESKFIIKRNEFGINRVYKLVDTCAAEFEAKRLYYYSTFEDEMKASGSEKRKSGDTGQWPQSYWSGVLSLDYSCVHGVLAAKECGYETIMINCQWNR